MCSRWVRHGEFILRLPLNETVPSLLHHLQRQAGTDRISKDANVFLLHSYACSFGKLLDTVANWERQHRALGVACTPFYYFRPVVNYYVPLPGVESRTCHAAIRSTRRAICILDWENPSVLRRGWCMYEASCCLLHGASLTVAMNPADEAIAASEAARDTDGIIARISAVASESAEAFKPSDLESMQPVIASRPGGHAAVNRLFTTAIALCLARVCIHRSVLPTDALHDCSTAARRGAAVQLLQLATSLLHSESTLVRHMHAEAVRLLAHAHCDAAGQCNLTAILSELESLCSPDLP